MSRLLCRAHRGWGSATRGALAALLGLGLPVACTDRFTSSSCADGGSCAEVVPPGDGAGSVSGGVAQGGNATGGSVAGGTAQSGGGAGSTGGAPITAGTGGVAAPPSTPSESTGGTAAHDDGGADNGAGAAPAPACNTDRDCDDGLACNGKELCASATGCQAGKPPCENPDSAHCTVACSEPKTGDTAVCVVSGSDADGDGALSKVCKQKPGTDCDDTQKTVYPGAPEICDRLDNDCNGKIDFAEGLMLAGEAEEFGEPTSNERSGAVVAWSPAAGAFAFAWRDDERSSNLSFEVRSPAGVRLAQSDEVAPVAAEDSTLSLTALGSSFGLTWVSEAGVQLATFDSAGRRIADALVEPYAARGEAALVAPKVVGLGSGWAVAWGTGTVAESGVVGGRVVLPTGSVGAFTGLSWSAQTTSTMASLGSQLVFIATETNQLVVTLRNPSLVITHELMVKGSDPLVAATTTTFAMVNHSIASSKAAAGQITLYASTGNKLCGPVDIGMSGAVVRSGAPAALLALPNSYLVAYAGQLQEITLACGVGPLIAFSTDEDVRGVQLAGGSASRAGDPAGVNVIWQTGAFLQRRRFGLNLCNSAG